MANVTSAIDKSIDNNDNDNEIPFSRKLTPEMIRLYGESSVSDIVQTVLYVSFHWGQRFI